MGLSPFMQSLYEAQSQNAARQQAQIQNQQQAEEMARQAYRDAFQQHYQEELLKLQQGKAQQESAQQALMNPLEVEKAKADIGLTKARTESENKPEDINGKAVTMFTTLLSSGQASTPAQAEEAVKSFYPDWKGLTPGYKAATANAAVQAGRISPTQIIQPQFSPVGGTQGPEQPTPPGQFGMPQGEGMQGGVPQIQTGAPVEVQRPQEDLINQAMGLLTPAAAAAQDYKNAQTLAAQSHAREMDARIGQIQATIQNIGSQIQNRQWRQTYTPQRDAAKDALHRLDEAAKQNRWLHNFNLAKNKFAFAQSQGGTANDLKERRFALSIGQATGSAINRYLSPLQQEWNRTNTHLSRLQDAQRDIHERLQEPPPDPKDPKYAGMPQAYAADVGARQRLEAQNRALWGTNGKDGLIGSARSKMDELQEEMKPYRASLQNLPNTVIQGVKPPLIKSGNAPPRKPSSKATVDAIAKDLGF